jgi:hypothetical protein
VPRDENGMKNEPDEGGSLFGIFSRKASNSNFFSDQDSGREIRLYYSPSHEQDTSLEGSELGVRYQAASGRRGSRSDQGSNSTNVASSGPSSNMNDMDRDYVTARELSAEIKAIEERMDRRHAEIGGKIDLLAQSLGNAVDKISSEIQSVKVDAASAQLNIRTNLDRLSSQLSAVESKSAQDKRTILANLWAIVIGAVLAGLALIYATNSLIIASFEAGKP